jgi:hypothetical protein
MTSWVVMMTGVNTIDQLRQARYAVPITCGLCAHGTFTATFAMWGTCGVIKHVGQDVSIVRVGTCPKALLSIELSDQLATHGEFLHAKNYST